jgi:hypothetical protein
MTPEGYIERLGSLIASGQDAVALEFSRRAGPSILPLLSTEQSELIAGLLESAQMAVDLDQWDASLAGVESSGEPTRR